MQLKTITGKIRDVLDGVTGKNRFGRRDIAILKTLMMLAAVDGRISDEEIECFRTMAEKCRGACDASFAKLWEKALRSAGYILLQTRFLGKDELVETFVQEVERSFVEEIKLDSPQKCEEAFKVLDAMALADGDLSDTERACVTALAKRVREAHDQMISERYSRAAVYG